MFPPHPGLKDIILLLLPHSLVYNRACFCFANFFGGNHHVRFPYNRSPTFSEHVLTPFFSQNFFPFSLLSGFRLCWRNNENIFSLSTHFVPVKLTNSKNWSAKCWLYSWSTYALLFTCLNIRLAVCVTAFPGSPKLLKIPSWISRNVSSTKVALLPWKLFS